MMTIATLGALSRPPLYPSSNRNSNALSVSVLPEMARSKFKLVNAYVDLVVFTRIAGTS